MPNAFDCLEKDAERKIQEETNENVRAFLKAFGFRRPGSDLRGLAATPSHNSTQPRSAHVVIVAS
jgi:hypothetical protein